MTGDHRSDDHRRAASALVDALGSEAVLTAGARYDEARTIWNRAVDASPVAIVRCGDRADVATAVRIATAHRCSLSVKGGGHHWAGRALTGDVVIDLAPMRRVAIADGVATIEAGASSIEVATAAQVHGLAAVTGNLGGVGYAGLVLGGGYGPLTGRFGLASDNLVGVDMVTADGRTIGATEDGHADLLWAWRGGGESLGVATALTVTLHPVADLLSGAVAYRWRDAAAVVRAYERIVADGEEALTLTLTFNGEADGAPVVTILPAWCGAPGDDARIAEALRDVGAVVRMDVSRKRYVDMLADAEAFVPDATSALNRTVTLPRLDAAAVGAIVAGIEARPSPLSYVVVHPFRGAGERVPLAAGAFGVRVPHYVVGICAVWRDGDPAVHQAWADAVEAALRPHAIDSCYPNYAGIDRLDGRTPPNSRDEARFAAVRRTYDPEGVFAPRGMRRG